MKCLLKRMTSVLCSLCLAFGGIATITPMFVSAEMETNIYGDVNNDGLVDVCDVVALLEYLAGDILTSDVNLKYSDVDKNTVIDINDAKIITKYILNSISYLPYSETGSTFNYNTYSVPTDETREYIKYNCLTANTSYYQLSPPSSINAVPDPNRSGSYDDRILDSAAEAQCIVYLLYKTSNGEYHHGTGFIVDDHVIATCAHCLYDGTAFNTNYTIMVYNTNGTSVIATYPAKELHIPTYYYNYQYNAYDYGLVYVEADLSQYGKMAIGIATDNYKYTGQTVNVSGFPDEIHINQPNQSNTMCRYYGSGNVTTDTTNYTLWYTSYTSSGDSGGPVYIEYTLGNEVFRSAIGIHTNGTTIGQNDIHFGTRITLPVSRFFYSNSHIG